MKKRIVEIFSMDNIKRNKKKVVCGAVAIGAVFIVGLGVFFLNSNDSNNENVVYVNKVSDIINPSSLGRVNNYIGVIETQKEIKIQPEEERGIEKINVKEGDKVEVGTVLFTYSNQESNDKLAQAKIDLERITNSIELKKKEINAISDNLDKMEAQGELKKSELEYKSKSIEIEKLEEALKNIEFKSEIAGVVKELNPEGGYDNFTGKEKPFMTIISLGNYRVKGKINEQNIFDITPGQEVIIRSRVDDDITWKGTISEINTTEPMGSQNDFYGGDGMSSSSSYPFYVELSTFEGLMLGQHVYIEPDIGQVNKKEGLWLDAAYISQEEDNAFVWADDGHGKLEKRKVNLGEFDEDLYVYKIESGLKEDDLITYNEFGLKEKMKTKPGNNAMYGMSNPPEPEFPEEGMVEDGNKDDKLQDDAINYDEQENM